MEGGEVRGLPEEDGRRKGKRPTEEDGRRIGKRPTGGGWKEERLEAYRRRMGTLRAEKLWLAVILWQP